MVPGRGSLPLAGLPGAWHRLVERLLAALQVTDRVVAEDAALFRQAIELVLRHAQYVLPPGPVGRP